ncbi:sister chromatid cohesion protein PDS5-like protein [Senna tora]|uniref:Sister chromatid cohesion protein PDS5-like protein n=1 Tax=Senna tora TaxID=362788 RepID=A0A834SY27_9FABA|nr:sister chromatid cohesion protein PDS5-like protein [Senna tora]
MSSEQYFAFPVCIASNSRSLFSWTLSSTFSFPLPLVVGEVAVEIPERQDLGRRVEATVNISADLVMENVNHMNGAFAYFSMASSSFGENRGIPVVGIRNTYCECGTRAIMISESERNPNRLYATCAKYPKYNYYVWLTPRGFGGHEPGNEDTNNSEQFPVDNINFVVLEARVAKIESMLGWVKMCIAFVMFVVVILMFKL